MQSSNKIMELGFRANSGTAWGSMRSRKMASRLALILTVAYALPSCTTTLSADDKNCSAFVADQNLPFDLEVGHGRIELNGREVIDIKTEPKWFCHNRRRSEEIYSIIGKKYRVDITYQPNASRMEIDAPLSDASTPPDMEDSIMNIWYLTGEKGGLLRVVSNEYFS